LIKPETSNHGDITLNDFATFFRQGWGWFGFIGVFVLCTLVAAAQIIPSFWLSHWTTQSKDEQRKAVYPLVFAGLVLLYTILSFSRAMFLFRSIIASSTTLLNKVTARVLRAQIVFFDSNPVGRILTRFTKDVIVFDLLFPV
jgi:ATP-binding cassette, subfamily C (CFTR/MRP), member 4